jgi:predicted RNA-binding protein (virulence factor B family)
MNTIYHPTRKDIIAFIKENPWKVFVDDNGRIYGPMPSNEFSKSLFKDGTVDPETMFLCWIYLPFNKQGTFVDKTLTPGNTLTSDEFLQFPQIGDEFELFKYVTKESIGTVKLSSLPEKITPRSRSTSAIFEVLSVNRKRKV